METLKKAGLRYARSLAEASLDPLFTISPDGKIIDVNNASIIVTDITRKNMIGTDFFEYFTEPDKAREICRKVFAEGSVTDFPLTIYDGKLTEVLFNGSVYQDETGIVLGAILVARDIGERKLAAKLRIANQELVFQNNEKEKRAAELIIADKELAFQNNEKEKRAAELILANKELLFQNQEKEKQQAETLKLEAFSYSLKLASQYSLSLIEASLDPLVTISTEGKITDMNEAMANITGMTREELTGTDFLDYFTEPQRARQVYQEVFAKGSVADSPLTIRHTDGELTDVLFNGSVYKDDQGKVVGIVIVARDVTAQKIFEKELVDAKVNAELAAENAMELQGKAESATKIAEDAQSKAEKATEIAENAVKSKQQFLSNMSHEIRTPMNAIIGFTKVLLKTDLTDKQKEYLTAIKMSGDALTVLINDILDLAKVDAGKMKFEQTPFKLAISISAMIHLFETKIQEKNLLLIKKYDDNIPKVLVGDPVRLHQIILNLVSNAVKFTTEGNITVSVLLLDEDEERAKIEFAVSDTGIGIAKEKMEHIFENFQQATSETARLYGGTGLGLAIAKQLVESQGGTIAVKSILGKGSTFSFIMTFLKTIVEIEQESALIEMNSEIKNIKVLAVEDIALNQLLMKTLLDDYGFEHDIASNGKIAIEKLQNREYDIILMDLQMPELNGFETTEYIRNKMKSNIPIIALTADVTTADLQKCTAVGMNDYISKPVDEKKLYIKIVDLYKKSKELDVPGIKVNNDSQAIVPKSTSSCIDLTYLNTRTKSNRKLMMEMIGLYLEQTPPLVIKLKQSADEKDWEVLYATVHKMIPSFSIIGMNKGYENMAKKIQEYASRKEHLDKVQKMVVELDSICSQACKELEKEFDRLKQSN
jgi:PAS domain S-box-containing protein